MKISQLLSVCLSAGLFAFGLTAQEVSTTYATGVEGKVVDASGAIIPNAPVVLKSDVAPARSGNTDAQGNYSFHNLQPGTYRVEVTVSGFAPYTSGSIQVGPNQTLKLDASLQPAGTATEVNVVENAGQVETSDPTVSTTLESKDVLEKPMNGRVFTQMLALAPGVSNQTGQDEAKVGVQGSASFSVNGGRTEYNSFDLDGSDLLNTGFNGNINTLVVYPSLDAIGEMKVLTSNYGAMYGRTASGMVMLSTKSGTSTFHGDGYGFLRNEAFNARNFFDQTRRAPLYRRYDAGFTLGGPIYFGDKYNKNKDKTFFFFSEEYRNERSPYEFNQGVPSVAERNGNFSDVCPKASQLIPGAQAYFLRSQWPDCPGSLSDQVPGLVPFPKNNIFSNPQNYLDRNSAAILSANIIPLPNSSAGCDSSIGSCYDATVSVPTHWHEELFRIDHYLTQTTRLMFRYIHDSWNTITPTPQYGAVQSSFPTIQNSFVGPGTSVTARVSQTLSPTLLNEVFFSFTNSNITLTDADGAGGGTWRRPAALSAPCSLTIQPTPNLQCPMGLLFPNGGGGKVPGVVFQTGPAYGNGFAEDPGYMPWHHNNPVENFGDSMSVQASRHFVQFGGEVIVYNRTQTNSVSGAATGDTQGILTYNGGGTGNAFADFLLEGFVNNNPGYQGFSPSGNRISSFQQDSGVFTYHQRYEIAEPYIQDDWRVTNRLTLNLGFRLSLFGRYHEVNHNVFNWEASHFNKLLASQVVVDQNTGYLDSAYIDTFGQTTPIAFTPNHLDPHLTNGLVRCGTAGIPEGCMTQHLLNPAPRIGFAWDPAGNGKNAIRGGYGIFFEHGTGNEANTGALEGSAPLVLSMTQQAVSDVACIGNPVYCPNGTPGQLNAYPLNVTSIQTHAVWPYVQQWSFSFQHQFAANTVATFAYVGSKGTHLTAERQINELPAVPSSRNPFGLHEPFLISDCGVTARHFPQGYVQGYALAGGGFAPQGSQAFNNIAVGCVAQSPPDTLGALASPDGLRPYIGFGQIIALDDSADSSYNAFQSTLRHRMGGLDLGASYTYSHSFDDSSDRFDPVPDSYNVRSNWASSNFDQRHLLNLTYVYDIPFGKWFGVDKAASATARNWANGWQISGITVYQSGTPFSVINGRNVYGNSVPDNAGVAGDLGIESYPDIVGSAHSAVPSGGNNGRSFGPLLLNPGAFVAPRGLTFGDAGRNSLNNPGRTNFDLSLFKNIPINEQRSVQFRAEAFNAPNHTQFEIFNSIKGNQPNNTITCYGGASSGYSAAGGGGTDCLTGSSFLHPIDAHRPRTVQLAVKYIF